LWILVHRFGDLLIIKLSPAREKSFGKIIDKSDHVKLSKIVKHYRRVTYEKILQIYKRTVNKRYLMHYTCSLTLATVTTSSFHSHKMDIHRLVYLPIALITSCVSCAILPI